eukprot:541251-Prorocentrum_minimum.AAC.1
MTHPTHVSSPTQYKLLATGEPVQQMLGVWVRWTHRTVFGAVVPHLILVGCRRSGWRCCFRVLLAALGLNEAPTAFR